MQIIRCYGKGALLAKAHIKSAFILLPISPLSFNSFGFCFDDLYFFDMCLLMGCSLSCTYFESFAFVLQLVVYKLPFSHIRLSADLKEGRLVGLVYIF